MKPLCSAREHLSRRAFLKGTLVTGGNPRVKYYVGTRPIWATPEGSKPIRELLG